MLLNITVVCIWPYDLKTKDNAASCNYLAGSFYNILQKLICVILVINRSSSVQFPTNPTSEMSTDDKKWNKTTDQSDESGHEVETDVEEAKEKKFLDDAMRTVLDPSVVIVKSEDVVENIKIQLEELDKENSTLEAFMDEMDKLSLEVCKTSSEALWSYVTDINNDSKKNAMVINIYFKIFKWFLVLTLFILLYKLYFFRCG